MVSFAAVALSALGATPDAPDEIWAAVRPALVAEEPALAGAELTVPRPGFARIQLATSTPVDAAAFDHLLAALAPHLGYRSLTLDVVGPAGEDLSPAGLSAASVANSVAHWRSAHASAGVERQLGGVPVGSLDGTRIAVSAGHGIQFKNGGWSFQRGVLFDLREDIHTNEVVFRYVAPMLEGVGAEVVLVRERSSYPERILVDNDGVSGGSYSEVGPGWADGTGVGFGGAYRAAFSDPAGGSVATWSFDVTRPAELPVYVWFLAAGNRSVAARYQVQHAAGSAEVTLDQTTRGSRWRYLGSFQFAPGVPAAVHLSNQGSNAATAVIADAVRLGGGMGFANYGAGPSAEERWEQSASTYAAEEQVPAAVLSGSNDVTVRPSIALWEGVDLYLAVHTNAGGGTGTSSFVYSNAVPYPNFDPNRITPVPPGTLGFQDAVHAALIDAFRQWDPAWRDRGKWGANFGELRPITQAWQSDPAVVIPATLVELAFHDLSGDAFFLREDRFRHDAARALLRGVLSHVHGTGVGATLPPLPPARLWAESDATAVDVTWEAAIDPLDPGAVPTDYIVERSVNGRTFTGAQITANPSWRFDTLDPCELIAVRVTAFNPTGRGLPSRTAVARPTPTAPSLLWVDGDRRLTRSVHERPEGPNTAARMMADLGRAWGSQLRIDSASDRRIESGDVALTDYDVVVWSTGETSSFDTTLSAPQQTAIADYLAAGGNLILSGAEIGWDLVAQGSAADEVFYAQTLKTLYLEDDAGTFAAEPGFNAAWLAGMPSFSFDDGVGRSFRVEYPDVIDGLGGAWVELQYDTGAGAAVVYDGVGKIFNAGFPLETIEDDLIRAEIFDRVLEAFLGPPPAAMNCPTIGPGDGGPTGDSNAGADAGGPRGDARAAGDSAFSGDDGAAAAGDPAAGCDCTQGAGAPWLLVLFLAVSRRRGRGRGRR